jgi:putative glutamine amidotransferase
MPPIIGITINQGTNSDGHPTHVLLQAYASAISEGGGVPVLIPSQLDAGGVESLYARLDGILFSGGGDIDPSRFSGEPHSCIEGVDPARDALELGLLHTAASDGKPFLGICRGCQLVNVAFGGNLYTHIPDQLPGALDHEGPKNGRTELVHKVDLESGTRVLGVMSEPTVMVNSHHHQGVRDLGSGLRVAGRAPDGLIEAVELPDHPFGIAVQWHPEWLIDQAATRRLFQAFVEAASQLEGR